MNEVANFLLVFFIEGDIGVGKSTSIWHLVRRNSAWSCFYEPVKFYNNDGLLNAFYHNPYAVAFDSQKCIFDSYLFIYLAS